jgi:hypothetical protein
MRPSRQGFFAHTSLSFVNLRCQLLIILRLLTLKIRQPSHEFTFGVGMSFIPYLLVLTPVV